MTGPTTRHDATVAADRAWSWTRWSVATVLLVAALGKVVQAIQTADLQPLPILAMAWELALALALLLHKRSAWPWALALGTCGGFLLVGLSLLGRDQSSCGCLGVITLPTRHLVLIDLILIQALWLQRPPRARIQSGSSLRLATAALLATLIALGFWGRGLAPAEAAAQATDRIHDPVAWIGHEPPLLVGVPASQLPWRQGRWDLVFIRNDCPHCRSYRQELGTARDNQLLIDCGTSASPPATGPDAWPTLRLPLADGDHLPTPCRIWLEAGQVTAVALP